MNPQDIRPDDRETLSALFDGELEAETRLFALRRLGHDAAWQQACGQWQLIGDAMRRNAPIAAPAGFADRVAAAVAAGSPAPERARAGTVPEASSARARRLRWAGGGALAASIALAITFTTLQPGQAPQGEAGAGTTVAAAPAPPSPRPTAIEMTAAVTPPSPASPDTGASSRPAPPNASPARVAPVVAVASASPRVSAPLPRRSAAAAAAIGNQPAHDASEAALLAARTGNPFNLASDEALHARPWPRATLGGSAFTARYGDGGDSRGERPSFYPFEPRPQGEAQPAPAP